jgi:antitoxin component of MazEF toxin-antitoxin module
MKTATKTLNTKFVFYKPDRRVQKTGNSLFISIPIEYIREMHIVAGQMMKPCMDTDFNLVFQPGASPDPYTSQFRKKKGKHSKREPTREQVKDYAKEWVNNQE